MEVDQLINNLANHTYLGQYQGHSYFLNTDLGDWANAKASVESLGVGYLAEITSAGENNFLDGVINQNTWIGHYQDANYPFYTENNGGKPTAAGLGGWGTASGLATTEDITLTIVDDNIQEVTLSLSLSLIHI